MPIFAKSSSGNFEVAPAGSYSAVCVDVIDLGMVMETFAGETKEQHKIKIVWEIDEKRKDGKRHQVNQRYTNSLYRLAKLRRHLESWHGQPLSDDECVHLDLESLIGQPCMLSVVHNVSGENTYANVAAVMKLPRGMTALLPKDYSRAPAQTTQSEPPPFGPDPEDMVEVPF
jgi:hypothetical protein